MSNAYTWNGVKYVPADTPIRRKVNVSITSDIRLLMANLTIAGLRIENRNLRVQANSDSTLIEAHKRLGREQELDLIRSENTVAELRHALSGKDAAGRQITRELSESMARETALRKQLADARAALATVRTPFTYIDRPREAPLGH